MIELFDDEMNTKLISSAVIKYKSTQTWKRMDVTIRVLKNFVAYFHSV